MPPSFTEAAYTGGLMWEASRPVYHQRPIACQTARPPRIVTGAYAMLYRGMDRAQLDAAYNNSAAVPERDAIVADLEAIGSASRSLARRLPAHQRAARRRN